MSRNEKVKAELDRLRRNVAAVRLRAAAFHRPHTMAEIKAEAVRQAILACGGNKTLAASVLEINLKTLYQIIKRAGLIEADREIDQMIRGPMTDDDDYA